jgi:hypothetical protein
MDSSTSRPVLYEHWRQAALWAGVLTGPLAWLTLLEVNYVSAYAACESRSTWFMHLAIVVALSLTTSAGYLAWTACRNQPRGDEAQAPPLSDETRLQRSRWMSVSGIAISAWFIVVILAMEVPLTILEECQ